MRHTLVISDVHLCEGVPGDDLWMRWRQKPYFPDDEFRALVDWVLAQVAPGDSVELVFNGDLFDFDAGRVMEGEVRFEDLPRSEDVSVDLMGRILDDHPGYVDAMGRLLAAGHAVVFVSGNHDPQLGFDGVRRMLRERLSAAAGHPRHGERVRFRGWFHQTADGVHIEHGNQYDTYCAFRYPMTPFVPPERGRDREIHPTVGSLAFRYLGARLGYMNPHVDDSFLLGLREYIQHWVKHYLFTERSLAMTWLKGAFHIVSSVALQSDPGSPDRLHRDVGIAARETGADPELVERHHRLFAPPAEESLLRVVREFWVDRMVLGALSGLAVLTPIVLRSRRAVGVAVGLPLLFAAYEMAVPSPGLDSNYVSIAGRAETIAEIYGCRGVVFGHTHVPYGRWKDGVFYGNSGTWSSAYRDLECKEPVDARGKPVIWLRRGDGPLEGGLHRWDGQALVADFSRVSPVDPTEHGHSRAPLDTEEPAGVA